MAEHDHDAHDHGTLTYLGSRVDHATLAALRELHADLAENLALTARFPELTPEEKEAAGATQRKVEGFATWMPGYHAEGDRCAGCGKATTPLFFDRFDQGELGYGAFVANVPVHPARACVAAFAKAHPRVAPRDVDRLRRAHTRDMARPSASMSQFFRHDVLTHPPFALEDWAHSVAEANDGLDKATLKDMERLLTWMHRRLFH